MVQTINSGRRADEIRERRMKTTVSSRKRISGPKKRGKMRSEYSPPVLARASLVGNQMEKRQRKRKTRRRFDVSLGASGAEIRLPSLPLVGLSWRVVSAMMVAGLLFSIYQVWNSTMFRVQSVEIVGLERLKNNDVIAALGVMDQPVFALNPGKMMLNLKTSFPEFLEVAVEVNLPAQVVVTVTERKPVLTWKQDGKVELVDASGMAFPMRSGIADNPAIYVEALGPLPVKKLPEATIDTTKVVAPAETKLTAKELLSPAMVSAILTMARHTPKDAPLVYDPQHGLGWNDPRGWIVYLGDAKDFERKLQVYEALVKQLNARKIKPNLISVEYLYAPYYRAEQEKDG
jgi:hypothetical protein